MVTLVDPAGWLPPEPPEPPPPPPPPQAATIRTIPTSPVRTPCLMPRELYRCDREVEDEEQEHPDDVHEVPVERRRRHAHVVLGVELTAEGAGDDERQEYQPAQDVRPVEARHGEEGAAELVQAAEVDVGVQILIGLAVFESGSQQ